MEELQSAVLVSLDPTADRSVRERALAYCQNVRSSADGWVFAMQCLSLSMRPEAAFWCLQVVQEITSDSTRYPTSLSAQQLTGLRSTLLSYMSQVVYPERFASTGADVSLPTFLYNKVAQLVVTVIAADYPHAWPEAFGECILPFVLAPPDGNVERSVTYASVAMFFRLLRALDDDVTSVRAAQTNEVRRVASVRVKDAMREDCIPKIVDVCTELLREPKFAAHAFDILGRYVEWVDISLIVCERILSPMYEAITATASCQWRGAAAAALRAILLKRMDVASKAYLLQTLDIDKLLGTIRADIIVANDDGSVDSELNLQGGQAEVAGLVNTVAISALEIMRAVWKAGSSQSVVASDDRVVDDTLAAYIGGVARNALPVALQFLDENSEDGSGAQTLECVTTYVNVYGQAARQGEGASNEESISVICAILKVVEERGRFAPDMDPADENSEKGRAFCELRKVLVKNVFTSVARSFLSICVDFVKNLYAKARETRDIGRLELTLSMLVSLTSVTKDSPEVNGLYAHVIGSPPECLDFSAIQAAGGGGGESLAIAQTHQLEAISSSYFEVVGRCTKILLGEGDDRLLSGALNVIFDGRGLGHLTSETVRSRAAHSLVKISKPLRGVMSLAHIEAVVRAAHSHLFPVEEDVESQRWKNQMMMFETVGYLLGTDQKREGGVQLVIAMLKPIVNGLESKGGQMGSVSYVAAAGYLSKGFGGDCKVLSMTVEGDGNGEKNDGNPNIVVKKKGSGGMRHEMREVWVGCIDAVVKVGSSSLRLGGDGWLLEMRLKLIFFLHRMVDTVGERVVPYLERIGSELLKFGRSAPELREVISLMSQSAIKFGHSFKSVAMKLHTVIVQQVDALSLSVDPRTLMASSEADREALDVVRAFLYWLNALVGSGLTDVLIIPGQEQILTVVMNFLVQNAVSENMDVRVAASVMRMAWLTLGRMIERWGNNAELKGFNEFLTGRVLDAMVASGLKSVLFRQGDYSSGQSVSVMTDIVKVQRLCALKLGDVFPNALYKLIAHAVTQQDWLLYMQRLRANEPVAGDPCVQGWTTIVQRIRSTG